MASYLSDHQWIPVERITVGWLYRRIYKATCHCGALLKRDGTLIDSNHHKVE